VPPWIIEEILDKRGQHHLLDSDMPLLIETAREAVGTDQLPFLSLRGAISVTDAGFSFVFKECDSLEALDASFCERLGDAAVAVLSRSALVLKQLNLTGCRLITDRGCNDIGRLRRLEQLELELCNKVSDLGVQSIARGCQQLKQLNLGGTKNLTNVSVQILADHCTNLTELNLGGNPQLMDQDVMDICRKLMQLRSLQLRACWRVTDRGLKSVAALVKRQRTRGLSELSNLDLGGMARLTNAGARELLETTTGLTLLDLRGCKLLGQETVDFARTQCPNLNELTLPPGCT